MTFEEFPISGMAFSWRLAQNNYRKYGQNLFKRRFITSLCRTSNHKTTCSLHTEYFCLNKILWSGNIQKANQQCQNKPFCTNATVSSATAVKKGEEKRRLLQAKKEAKRAARLEKQIKKQEKEFLLKGKSGEKNGVVYNIQTAPGDKKDTSIPLPASYSPKYVEAVWYDWWCKEGFFKPEYLEQQSGNESKEKFVICLPPPNVTGTLHLGHALGNSIEDVLVRWHRMSGRATLWNPGCDHAGIATQVVVEKKLMREAGKTRHDLGREKFVEEVWKWKQEKGNIIYDQMKKLGSSLDWSRECFTLDKKLSVAVTEAFVRLHEEGLIYRSSQLVNWSCALKSAISDIEVEDISLQGKTYLEVPGYSKKIPFGTLTSFAYPIEGSDSEITVSTTRLETMLGDTAIAVHPDDPRYTSFHGKFAIHPFCDRTIPIICDEFVDKDFGTGAVKITPAHDYNDYEVGKRHNLPFMNVLDEHGKMINVPKNFLGSKRFEVREEVLTALKEKNLLKRIDSHAMNLPTCSRSNDIIEPLIKDQWFMDCQQMAQEAIECVKGKELTLHPEQYEKHYFDWLESIRPWCISRQLWWGHQIPAYKASSKNIQSEVIKSPLWISARSQEEALQKAAKILNEPVENITLERDEDVLDTWFSSALFPFSVFGWPNKTPDLEKYYPTSLLETASDIMFFWVARMVMLGQKLTGQLPFKEVLFHAILRDAHGRKMSKSLGNVIDPMDLVYGIDLDTLQDKLKTTNISKEEEKKAREGQKKDYPLGIPECGADALRFTLCSYNNKAYYVNVDVNHVKNNRNFCNKIWQAFKFVNTHLGGDYKPSIYEISGLESSTDLWILSRLSALVETCQQGFEDYSLSTVTQALNQFWWSEFCNVYLEYCKPILQSSDSDRIRNVQAILFTCVHTGLRTLSPFMPYLTEELYQRLPRLPRDDSLSICVAEYPKPKQYGFRNVCVEEEMVKVNDMITALLAIRTDFNLTKARANVHLCVKDSGLYSILTRYSDAVTVLSRSQSIKLDIQKPTDKSWTEITEAEQYSISLQLEGLVDATSLQVNLSKREEKLEKDLKKFLEKHSRDADIPVHVILADKEKVNLLNSTLQRIKKTLQVLRSS